MNLTIIFGLLSILVIGLHYGQKRFLSFLNTEKDAQSSSFPDDFKKFQHTYLIIFYLMALADWLQGPYVYEAYKYLGFDEKEISNLFLIGFGSSMVFGTIIGGLADKYGRKMMCLVYCGCYIVTCTVQHIPNFYILAIGRVCGGIATSILFSSFESWMVCQHHMYNFDPSYISNTFYKQYLGNGIIAIFAGLIAGVGESLTDNVLTAFKVAIVVLCIGAILIYTRWEENFGDANKDTRESFMEGLEALKKDKRVILTGISQSCYESAMFIFVFMWSPTLLSSDNFNGESFGFIFACFMVSVMVGSTLFNIGKPLLSTKKLLFGTFMIALAGLIIPVLTSNTLFLMMGFLLFEMTVGLFWPSISTMKAKYIPENVRSIVMNYFRLPTNIFVVGTLKFISSMSTQTTFMICCLLICGSLASTYILISTKAPEGNKETNSLVISDSDSDEDDDDEDLFDDMMERPDDMV